MRMTLVVLSVVAGMMAGPVAVLRAQVVADPFGERQLDAALQPPVVNPLQLLAMTGVRQELRLNQRQVGQIEQLATQVMQLTGRPPTIPTSRNVLDGFVDNVNEMQANEQRLVARELARVLNDKQRERLEQLNLQFQGVDATANREVIDALGLTPRQQTDLSALRRERFQYRIRELQRTLLSAGDATANREAMFARLKEIDRVSNERMKRMLTADQNKLFREMQGEPFDGFIAIPPTLPGYGSLQTLPSGQIGR